LTLKFNAGRFFRIAVGVIACLGFSNEVSVTPESASGDWAAAQRLLKVERESSSADGKIQQDIRSIGNLLA
jgi:hypothetical protein